MELYKPVGDENNDFASWLISQGADVNAKIDGKSPVKKAIDEKNLPMFLVVLGYGATIHQDVNVDFVSERGTKCLHHTALSLLVSNVLDTYLNTQRSNVDEKQFSRLRQLIEQLIDAGANIHYRNGNGQTPFEMAQAHQEVLALLQVENSAVDGSKVSEPTQQRRLTNSVLEKQPQEDNTAVSASI